MKNSFRYCSVLLSSFVVILLLSACGGKSSEKENSEKAYTHASMKDGVLHLDLDKVRKDSAQINLSDICDDLIYIPLETNKKCLISDSDSRKYLIDGDNLFIRDKNSLYHFNTKGEFISQFGSKGRGTNEFVCGDICLDKENNRVYAIGASKKRLMKYDYTGKLLSDNAKCDLSFVMYLPKSKTIVGSNFYSLIKNDKNEYNMLWEMNMNGEIVDKVVSKYYPDHFFKDVDNTSFMLLGSSFYNFKDDVYVQELASDTVFMKTKNGMKAHMILNNRDFKPAFTSNEVGPSEFIGMTISTYTDFLSGYASVSVESDRFVFLTGLGCRYVYDKTGRKFSMSIPFGGGEHTNSSYFFNDMDGLSHMKDIQLINNEYLATSIQAIDLLEYLEENKDLKSKYYKQLAKIAEGMTEESNPVLVLAHLKK